MMSITPQEKPRDAYDICLPLYDSAVARRILDGSINIGLGAPQPLAPYRGGNGRSERAAFTATPRGRRSTMQNARLPKCPCRTMSTFVAHLHFDRRVSRFALE